MLTWVEGAAGKAGVVLRSAKEIKKAEPQTDDQPAALPVIPQ